MPRKSTGTVRIIRGRWHGKWTLEDRTDTDWKLLPGVLPVEPCCSVTEPACEHRLEAKACAARHAPNVRRLSAEPSAETCDRYFHRLSDARKADGIRDTRKEKTIWGKWLSPRIGKRAVVDVTRDEIEAVRDALDAQVRLRIKEGLGAGISGATAQNVWSVLRTTFKESVSSRDRTLRLRSDDPTAGHKPPLKTPDRKKTFIYPSEFAKLLACEGVPIAWRRVYAVAAYLYVRPEELQALLWSDVDFEACTVQVSKATDARTGKPKELPKTSNAIRAVPIDSELVPLLEDMRKGKDAGATILPVLGDLNDKFRAKQIRKHLRKAGVNRERLFQETATLLPVNFRSCRDSGITWLALAGLDLKVMKARAGHDVIDTTDGYVKMAEDLRGKVGTPFAPLPPGLLRKRPEATRVAKNAKIIGLFGAGGGNRTHGHISPETPENKPDRASEPSPETTRPERVRDKSPVAETTTSDENYRALNTSPQQALDTSRGSLTDEDIKTGIVNASCAKEWKTARFLRSLLKERGRAKRAELVHLAMRRKNLTSRD